MSQRLRQQTHRLALGDQLARTLQMPAGEE
jgi:hypothetical protein